MLINIVLGGGGAGVQRVLLSFAGGCSSRDPLPLVDVLLQACTTRRSNEFDPVLFSEICTGGEIAGVATSSASYLKDATAAVAGAPGQVPGIGQNAAAGAVQRAPGAVAGARGEAAGVTQSASAGAVQSAPGAVAAPPARQLASHSLLRRVPCQVR